MRIGLFITSLVGGGAERVVLTLAEGLLRRGHEVDLYVLTSRIDYTPQASVRVHRLSETRKVPHLMPGAFYRRAAARFHELLIQHRQQHGDHDMFLFNLPEDYVLGHHLALPNAFYVVHTSIQHALAEQARRGRLRAWSLQRRYRCLRDKHVVAVSRGVQREIASLDWLPVASVRTIYNPFDIEAIRAMSEQAIDVPQGDYLLHIGRAARVKRHDVLFAALRHLPEHVRLVLLSKDRDKLSRMARRAGVADRVVLPGFQDNPYPWMKHARCLVLCSDYEGLGNVLIESLICGTPVVSTDCPYGPAEILTGPYSEWLVPVGDARALAERLQDALECYRPGAPVAILDEVAIDNVIDGYLSLIDRTTGQDE